MFRHFFSFSSIGCTEYYYIISKNILRIQFILSFLINKIYSIYKRENPRIQFNSLQSNSLLLLARVSPRCYFYVEFSLSESYGNVTYAKRKAKKSELKMSFSFTRNTRKASEISINCIRTSH